MRAILIWSWLLVIPAAEDARRVAVERALAFLQAQFAPDGRCGARHPVAATSLAGLAMLAAGEPVHRPALTFVLARQDEQGYFSADRMYGHGLAALFLAEAVGQTRDDELDARVLAALTRAIGVTLAAQRVAKDERHAGGWRYNPGDATSDLSLTGWQLLALRAARSIGVAVPDSALTMAQDYVRGRCDDEGRVGYHNRGDDRPALRGLALLALSYGSGDRDAERMARIVERITADPIAWRGPWFFYRVHYDAQGLAAAAPAAWAEYRRQLHGVLLANQLPNGAWPAPPGDNEAEHGPVYATAMAVLALCVDDRLLPAWRR